MAPRGGPADLTGASSRVAAEAGLVETVAEAAAVRRWTQRQCGSGSARVDTAAVRQRVGLNLYEAQDITDGSYLEPSVIVIYHRRF